MEKNMSTDINYKRIIVSLGIGVFLTAIPNVTSYITWITTGHLNKTPLAFLISSWAVGLLLVGPVIHEYLDEKEKYGGR